MNSPLLSKTFSEQKKYQTLSVSLPSEMKDAIINHFERKGDVSKYIVYLVEKDLHETGCEIVDGVIVNKNQLALAIGEDVPFPEDLDVLQPDNKKKRSDH